jgi:RteC protein
MNRNYFETLRPKIEATLDKSEEDSPAITKYLACVEVINEEIEKNKKLIQEQPFDSKQQEMLYYKREAPEAYGQLVFFTKLARIEGARKYRSPKSFRELLQEELLESDAFLHKHDDMCQYYYENRTHLDDHLFTRHSHGEWSGDEIGAFIHEDFTIGAYWLSWIKAHERLRSWLGAALDETAEESAPKQANRLPCLAKPVEMVEVFKSFHLAGWFGKATFKEVMEWVRDELCVKIGNYDIILQELAIRKTSRTKALDRLKDELGKWLDEKL